MSCDPGPVMIGSGKPTWRRESAVAGPLGIRRHPLRDMSPYRQAEPNVLVTKAPILVEGAEPVTLSVPPALVDRVFLYYGFHKGPDGKRSTAFYGYPGSSTVEFQPCADKPRTVWPGGLRVKGRGPVHLDVGVAGRTDSIPLRLGRPAVYDGR
ncbi:MAG TPA: hypothetical protein VFI09_04625 [Solirubrobacterales bacterium]|nr:hypothetical protein [Solirubrobacterales bacterium]